MDLARILEDAAVLHAANGDTDAARATATEAVDIYTGLGATWDVRRAHSRIRPYHIHTGTHGTGQRPTHGWNALSPTEATAAR